MQKASTKSYNDAYTNLKSCGVCRVSNNFLDANALKELLENRDCQMHATENSLLLFIPYHDAYYDCLYVSRNSDALLDDLNSILPQSGYRKPVRLSIVGKGKAIENLSADAAKNGFPLQKKLLRVQLEKAPEKINKAIKILGSEWLPYAEFAKPGDEEEIFNLLRDNFDLVSENLPELPDIRANIDKKHVIVLRLNGKMAAAHYFSIINNISYNYYDVTHEDYRHMGGLFFGISLFKQQYFEKSATPLARSFGWREESRERLVKFSKKTNEIIDGVAIYNHLWTPEN